MFKIIIKVYEIRYCYYKKLRDKALEDAKDHLFDDDKTEYRKCMRRASKYITKLDKLSKRTNKIIYG